MIAKLQVDKLLDQCDTLMFDMDGTLLDLAFDNYMWLHHIPSAYAANRGIEHSAARDELYGRYRRLQGQLDWYCLDHWSEHLGIDVLALHRNEHHRIDWLPGARELLEALSGSGVRLLLVTNSHPDTLAVKSKVTGIARYFDCIYSSHEFGYAKEDQRFWHALQQRESFDPVSTLFVDDSEPVLSSAARFGLDKLLAVTRPDSTRPVRSSKRFTGIERVADLKPGLVGSVSRP